MQLSGRAPLNTSKRLRFSFLQQQSPCGLKFSGSFLATLEFRSSCHIVQCPLLCLSWSPHSGPSFYSLIGVLPRNSHLVTGNSHASLLLIQRGVRLGEGEKGWAKALKALGLPRLAWESTRPPDLGQGKVGGSTLSSVWEDGASSEQTQGICTQSVSMDTRQGKRPMEQRKCLDETADMTS